MSRELDFGLLVSLLAAKKLITKDEMDKMRELANDLRFETKPTNWEDWIALVRDKILGMVKCPQCKGVGSMRRALFANGEAMNIPCILCKGQGFVSRELLK